MRGRVIQVRGASGSGKTTLMRRVMAGLPGEQLRVRVKDDPTRKKPSLLVWPRAGVAVVGHYDVLCGGVDTVKHRERPYELVRMAADQGLTVLLEGLFATMEFHRTVALERDGYDRHDVFLATTQEQCRANVDARRALQGKGPGNQKQMAEYYPRVRRTHQRLSEAGLGNLHWLTGTVEEVSAQAEAVIASLLPSPAGQGRG